MTNSLQFDENTACDACGRFGAYRFETQRLCVECYAQRGSCCTEFNETSPRPELPADAETAAPRPDRGAPP